ncbi:MAG: hypothetical protein IH786_12185, partial [Proteobacteria bacterium]|nr:hypothetical protein [Pseudomonadota bacterium]
RDPIEALIEDALAGELESPAIKALARGLARVMRALAPLVEAMETLRADPREARLRAPALGSR